jgi:hypothetical protein
MTIQWFTGKEYLKIDIASNFGLDKVRWQERIDWFDANEAQLESMLKLAKEPALFFAGVQAWRAVQAGKAIGYMISLDATSSGLQILACLMGDAKAAKLCNVIDTGNRENAYQGIYNAMLAKTGGTSVISLEDTKQAIMTALYSSKAEPKRVFGEGTMLDIFYETMAEEAPGAWELNEAMLTAWNPEALSHNWTLPDNFHVQVKVMGRTKETVHFLDQPFDIYTKYNGPQEQGRSLGANMVHSIDGMIVREMSRRCDYDINRKIALLEMLDAEYTPLDKPNQNDEMVSVLWAHYKASNYLSARVLDHLAPTNVGLVDRSAILELLLSMPDKPFKVISVHDCFRCLPHYGNDLRKQYNLQLALIARSNMLSYLISQIIGRPIQLNKIMPRMDKLIEQANYALS